MLKTDSSAPIGVVAKITDFGAYFGEEMVTAGAGCTWAYLGLNEMFLLKFLHM
jgi:hypothetical protein